jgi:uncharacterized protein YdeI (BOF family)
MDEKMFLASALVATIALGVIYAQWMIYKFGEKELELKKKLIETNPHKITFEADQNTANTIMLAYNNAQLYGESGITLDGSIVTTTESTTYQFRKGTLLILFKRTKGGDRVSISYITPLTAKSIKDGSKD